MAAMLYDVAVAVVSETLSSVWLEAVMFGLAAITYLAVWGGTLAKKPLKGGRNTQLRSQSAKTFAAKTASYPPRSKAAAARIASNEPKILSTPDAAKTYASVVNNIRERGNARDLQGAVAEFERLPLLPNH